MGKTFGFEGCTDEMIKNQPSNIAPRFSGAFSRFL